MGTQEMIYAVVAAVIAGLVLLTMYSVRIQGQEASIDAVQYRTSKKSMLSLVEVVERDFKNMGSYMYWNGTEYKGMELDPKDVIQPGWHDSTAVTGGYRYWFQFSSQPDSLQPPGLIRYEWEPINGKTVTLNDGTARQLYEVRRYADGTLTTSTRLITHFDINLQPDASTPILVNLHEARVFDVSIRSISPLGKADTIEETRFDATYRPVGMAIMDNLN